jgi:MFS family permease
VLYGVVMTVGANCIGMVVFVPLISRLFAARRGMAISVLQAANGLGRAVSAPAAQLLVGGMGWRGAYLVGREECPNSKRTAGIAAAPSIRFRRLPVATGRKACDSERGRAWGIPPVHPA